MKRVMFFVLFLALLFGMSAVPTSVYGDVINVVCEADGEETENGNDNKREEFPHLMPPRYSRQAIAHWNSQTGILTIDFNAETEEATIEIYQDGFLVSEITRSISYGDMVFYNLSSFGSGDYQIVISGLGNLLYGSFVF